MKRIGIIGGIGTTRGNRYSIGLMREKKYEQAT